MEKDNNDLAKINLIQDFVQRVRVAANKRNWLTKLREYREETEKLVTILGPEEDESHEDE